MVCRLYVSLKGEKAWERRKRSRTSALHNHGHLKLYSSFPKLPAKHTILLDISS